MLKETVKVYDHLGRVEQLCISGDREPADHSSHHGQEYQESSSTGSHGKLQSDGLLTSGNHLELPADLLTTISHSLSHSKQFLTLKQKHFLHYLVCVEKSAERIWFTQDKV